MKNKEILYGIVEGFFSDPLPLWSKEERLDTLQFIKQYAKGINAYYYCPKDDQFVTNKWDTLYPDTILCELKSVVNYCAKENIEFIYGLNPLVICAEDILQKEFIENIVKKFKQMQSIGVKSFSLLFDDLPVAYDVVFNTIDKEETLFSSLVGLVNGVYSEISSNTFWFCGPDYCFRNVNSLNKTINELSPEIGVIWSGNTVFANKVTNKDIKRVKKIVGEDRKLVFWLNYPVNDCEQSVGTYNLGAFPEMINEVYKNFDGIVVNPMRECHANLPFYITFSDFIKRQETYSRSNAWGMALQTLFDSNAMKFRKILDMFSSKNCIDNKVGIKSDNAIKTVKGLQERRVVIQMMKNYKANRWGEVFFESISSLLEESEDYMNVMSDVMNGYKVSKELFEKVSRFPTDTNKARYLKEVLNIVNARLQLFPKLQKNLFNKELEKMKSISQQFIIKYQGKNALKITGNDEKIMLDLIISLVNLEKTCYLNFINNKEIKCEVRFKTFKKRQYINKFTI